MKYRTYWVTHLQRRWTRPILWISGVRRAGKTFLSRMLDKTSYFDCELPRVRRMMEDPEGFLDSVQESSIVLDEIHRLDNPSELLKIAADHFPNIKVLATGSSSLGASSRFRDTLTGRKTDFLLTPMISDDLTDFGNTDISHRLLHGGLPPFFLSDDLPERDFQEWMDSFWAKDVLELFRLERRHSFMKFFEMAAIQSGGIFEATRFARPCEVSRTTIANYLSILDATYAVSVIRPFSTYRPTEIVSAPKVYAFDTGFVCYAKGWRHLRPEDYGILWEHLVLNEMQARLQTRRIFYWRNKKGLEVDFVLSERKRPPLAVETKWSADEFDAAGLKAFRRLYEDGENWIVARDVDHPYFRNYSGMKVEFLGVDDFNLRLESLSLNGS